MRSKRWCSVVLLAIGLSAAIAMGQSSPDQASGMAAGAEPASQPAGGAPLTPGPGDGTAAGPAPSANWQLERLPDNVIRPAQLRYLGAFNVPKDSGMAKGSTNDRLSWGYGAGSQCGGLTYRPSGNPNGADKDFPGSLYGTGNEQGQCVSEFSIAPPKISEVKDWKELNYAETLQPFVTVTKGTRCLRGDDFPRSNCVYSLLYLPRQGDQRWDHLYWSGWHSDTGAEEWTRGACNAILSRTNSEGMWRFDEISGLAGAAGLMEIPKDWADKYCSGRYVAYAGVFGLNYRRAGNGPSILACAPWKEYKDAAPPPPGTALPYTALLLYGDKPETAVRDGETCDLWLGAAWVTHGSRSAVLFFGSKNMGRTIWGGRNGRTRMAESPRACIYFYNPDDLAQVAEGKMKPWEPQYYARLDATDVLFGKSRDLRGCGYDRRNGLLYSLEYKGARDLVPIVHVWRLDA